MASPESCITNVLRTSVHNKSELKKVDEDFEHDAPCREDIYSPFIEAYSQPGETILDGFIGSGTAAVALSMGRNLIGYDIDHESIEFTQKRIDKILEDRNNSQSNMAA